MGNGAEMFTGKTFIMIWPEALPAERISQAYKCFLLDATKRMTAKRFRRQAISSRAVDSVQRIPLLLSSVVRQSTRSITILNSNADMTSPSRTSDFTWKLRLEHPTEQWKSIQNCFITRTMCTCILYALRILHKLSLWTPSIVTIRQCSCFRNLYDDTFAAVTWYPLTIPYFSEEWEKYLCCELSMTLKELSIKVILTRCFAVLKIFRGFHNLFYITWFDANVKPIAPPALSQLSITHPACCRSVPFLFADPTNLLGDPVNGT